MKLKMGICMIAICILSVGAATSQENIEGLLSAGGIKEPKVSLIGSKAVVKYKQPIAEIDGIIERYAYIIDTTSSEISVNTNNPLHF
jgi:hypothetical protein